MEDLESGFYNSIFIIKSSLYMYMHTHIHIHVLISGTRRPTLLVKKVLTGRNYSVSL